VGFELARANRRKSFAGGGTRTLTVVTHLRILSLEGAVVTICLFFQGNAAKTGVGKGLWTKSVSPRVPAIPHESPRVRLKVRGI
jgi:hypothetical protein